MRGSELANYKTWRDRRPADAPDLIALQRAYLGASEETQAASENAERKRLEDMALAQAERQKAIDVARAALLREAVAQSSTSVKGVDQAPRHLGQTRLKLATDRTRGETWREVQVQIRHPSFPGLEIDAEVNRYTPAHFVDRVEFLVGSQYLATLAMGISIFEDLNISLTFGSPSTEPMRMTARDSNGNMFEAAATAHEAMH